MVRKMMLTGFYLVTFSLPFVVTGVRADSPQSFSFQGRLFNSAGTAVIEEPVSIKFQILDPSASCLLYQESQSVDLTNKDGVFSLSIGSAVGAPKRTVGVDPGFSMAKVFKNDSTAETRAIGTNCPSGYTPTSGDHRLLRVTVTPSSTGVPEVLTPDQVINSVPQALVAETLQGLGPVSFVQKDPIYITDETLKKIFGSLVDGVVDASDLHHHDGRYVQASSSSSQNLGSGGFTTSGKGSIGTSTSFTGTTLSVKADLDDNVGLVVRGNSLSQSADLFQVQNSAGVSLASISNTGGVRATSTTLSSTSGDQLVVKYDETNKQTLNVNSTGLTTFTATGSAPKFSFMGGNVGIGTTTPAYTLDVLGDARLGNSGSLRFDGGAGQFIKGWSGRITVNFGTTEYFRFRTDSLITSQKIGFASSSGDTGDAYIARQAAGELRVSSDGSTGSANLFVNGKLGVGTNSAPQALTVVGNGYVSGVVYATGVQNTVDQNNSKVNTGTTGTQILRSVADSNPTLVVQQQNASSTGDVLQVKNSSSTVLTVQNGGNLGIGTTTPTSNVTINPITVNSGTVTMTASNGSSSFTTSGSVTLNAGDYLVPTNSTAQARAISVGGTGTSFTVASAFTAAVNGETYTIHPGTLNVNSGKLFVQGSTGFVGMGTNLPTSALTVTGWISASTGFGVGNTQINNTGVNSNLSSGTFTVDKLVFTHNGSSTSGKQGHQLLTTFNPASGTPTNIGLEIYPTINWGGTPGAGSYEGLRVNAIETSIPSGQNYLFRAGTGGTTFSSKFDITNTGSVGIGTSTPQTKLQVEGVISPATNNTYTLGSSSYRFTEVFATNGTVNTSDLREKKDIRESDLGLDFINKLRPVSYKWNTGVDNDVHYGLIAQEASTVLKRKTSIVTHDKKSDRYGVRYSELIAPLIKSVQEIYMRLISIETHDHLLKREIASIKEENKKLKEENTAIKAYLCTKDPKASICTK